MDDPGKARTRRRLRAVMVLCYLLFLALLVEGASFAAGRILQSKWSMYRDPVAPDQARLVSYAEYLERRHPRWGWPRLEEFGESYAPNGARWCLDSGVPEEAPWLVSLYGDSFTADAVGGDTDHWGCRMQRQLRARVENFGVGGYGTDQALLRYLDQTEDASRVVVLGHMSEDILRNLTRYRDFQNFTRSWAFKPRFVRGDGGDLEHVPLPRLTESEYRRFLALEAPQLFLEHELFHPNGPSGAVRLTFPYSIAFLRNLGYFELQSRLAGQPSYARFYEPGHPFGGLELTRAILLEFVKVARRRGQEPVLILFPDRMELEAHQETGRWYMQPLLESLQAAGIEPIQFGEVLTAHLDGRPAAEAFGRGSPGARTHYSLEVSHLVADTVLAHLSDRSLLVGASPHGGGSRSLAESTGRGVALE
ncbi:MAG TPA: hypothetical protein VKA74_09025 [Myxococcota bacterium]|nr:hypothetical protein [Myxococcota bacterium]